MQYARNLANTVYESIKRVVPWSVYYFTHDKSYYPVLRQSTPLNAIPKLEHLKARRELNRQEKDLIIEWATNNGKVARQRSVRQETTMFKAGTLPLNMYRTSDYPRNKVSFSHNPLEEETITSATTVTTTVNSLYCGHCGDLELVSSLARVRNSEGLFQSNVCNLFLPGI